MKTLHERVTRAITKSGHTASSAAKKLDVSPEAVLQWMSGATKNIRPTNLFALSDITGIRGFFLNRKLSKLDTG